MDNSVVSAQELNSVGITVIGTTAHYDSNLQNYSDVYDEWDKAEEDPCPSCNGTGMDRWEEFECETCWGEGYIPRSELLTRR